MPTEVRSRWTSLERQTARTGEPVEVRSQFSTSRADGQHLARSPGKGPAVRRPDNGNEPVTGENRQVIEERRLVRENADRR